MKTFRVRLSTEQVKWLSITFNNELTIRQPNLFKNVALVKQSSPNCAFLIEASILANCAKSLIKGIAIQLLNKSNLAMQNSRKSSSVSFTEAEAYALILCCRFGGFDHFGQYEQGILRQIIEKANQLSISD